MLPTIEHLVALVIREYFTFDEISSLMQEGKDVFFDTEQNYCVEVYDKARILKEPREDDPELLVVFSSKSNPNEEAITIRLSECKDV